MARWSVNVVTWLPVAVGDGSNISDNSYMGLQGGTTTQRINILEVYMGGQAGASSPSQMLVARDSTTAQTVSAANARVASLDPATAALGANPVGFTSATTKPQRSSTLSLLSLSYNAFGGIVRWVAAPGEEIGLLGNAVNAGEISLSHASTGTPGQMSSHFIIEPF